MFNYDAAVLAELSGPVDTVEEVLATMHFIHGTCQDADGLKWFNWLYLSVTEAVAQQIGTGRFQDSAWLAELDVQFARLYFAALQAQLRGERPAACWRALFSQRGQVGLTRLQFALAGINAHINHDLAEALVNTFTKTGSNPDRSGPHYRDYTDLNATLEGLVDLAKTMLNVRLLGEALPPFARLENIAAGFSVTAAREASWRNSEILWQLRSAPGLSAAFLESLDGLTAVSSKALLAVTF